MNEKHLVRWIDAEPRVCDEVVKILKGSGDRAAAAHQVGLGLGRGAPVGHTLRELRDGHAGLLGLDRERVTYRYQGRDFQLTDVHGKGGEGILA